MSTKIRIKIHDVFHDPKPYNPSFSLSEIEKRVEISAPCSSVENVQIQPGHKNSPIFIEIESGMVTQETINRASKSVLDSFSKYVDGVDIERSLRDDNIRLEKIG